MRTNQSSFGRIWQNGCSCTNGRRSSVAPALRTHRCDRTTISQQWPWRYRHRCARTAVTLEWPWRYRHIGMPERRYSSVALALQTHRCARTTISLQWPWRYGHTGAIMIDRQNNGTNAAIYI